MLRYFLRRLASLVLVILMVPSITFVIQRVIPGDPADSYFGEEADPIVKGKFRARHHLDKPMLQQFLFFWGDILNGSLGVPFTNEQTTVFAYLMSVYPSTLILALFSMAVALALAIPIGIISSLNRNKLPDHLGMSVALLGISIPNFFLGPLLLYFFYYKLSIFPGPENPSNNLDALILPSITLGTAMAAMLSRMTRSSMLEILNDDYIRTAKAKGLSKLSVIVKHAFRNALLPIISVTGLQFGALLAGAVITEKVFNRPGIGTRLIESIFNRDYPVTQGAVILIALSYSLVNFLTDMAYSWADPRIRLEK